MYHNILLLHHIVFSMIGLIKQGQHSKVQNQSLQIMIMLYTEILLGFYFCTFSSHLNSGEIAGLFIISLTDPVSGVMLSLTILLFF